METVWWPGSECDVFGHLLLLIAFINELRQALRRDLLCFCALNRSLAWRWASALDLLLARACLAPWALQLVHVAPR